MKTVILIASAYLLVSAYFDYKKSCSGGCGAGCSCGGSGASVPVSNVVPITQTPLPKNAGQLLIARPVSAPVPYQATRLPFMLRGASLAYEALA